MKKRIGFITISIIFCLTLAIASTVMAETRTATFDSIATGTDLTAYTEGNLKISTPTIASVDYYTGANNIFPSASPGYPGFSGGFFYPTGGVNAAITIKTTDNASIYDVKFNAGSGFVSDANVNLSWNIWSNGIIVGTGSSIVLKGTQVDFSYSGGFDSIDVYGTYNSDPTNFINDSNALALDNLIVNTSATTSAVPEPATMLLLGLGLAGVAVARKKFQK